MTKDRIDKVNKVNKLKFNNNNSLKQKQKQQTFILYALITLSLSSSILFMNTRNKKYLLQKLKSQHQEYRNKQLAFNNRFSIHDKKKPYDALQDPHASYYFMSRSVRNHLKSIKAAAINETTNSLEKERLKKLLNEKIKQKNKFFFNDPAFINLNQLITSQALRKTSMKTVQSQRKRSSQKTIERKNDVERVTNVQNKKLNARRERLKKREFGHLSQQFNKSSIEQAVYEQPQVNEVKDQKQSISQRRQISTKEVSSRNRRELASRKRKNLTIRLQGEKIRGQGERNERERKIKEEIHEKKHQNFMNFIEEKKRQILKSKQKTLEESEVRQENKQTGQENKNSLIQ